MSGIGTIEVRTTAPYHSIKGRSLRIELFHDTNLDEINGQFSILIISKHHKIAIK